jgi:hypothetical protein
VGSAHGGGTENAPGDVVPCFAQVPEDFLKGVPGVDAEKPSDVFSEEPSRANSANCASDFRPEPSVVIRTLSFAGGRGGLAGEARGEEVDGAVHGGPIHLRDVAQDRHVGPMVREDGARERVDLAEGRRVRPAHHAAR